MKILLSVLAAFLSCSSNAGQLSAPPTREIECAPEKIDGADRSLAPRYISLYSLIARPRDYHLRSINVVGVLRVGGTKIFIYPNLESEKYDIAATALMVSWPKCLDDKAVSKLRELSGHYVRIEGVYNAEFHENLEAGIGLLMGVTSISPNN
jgi:hypothetical protein